MEVAGIIEKSVDHFPGLVSFVIFTQGCNFRCHYCFNPELARFYDEGEDNSERMKEIMKKLEKDREVYDAVVISGGEPTIHKGLPEFLTEIKDLGMIIRLETNGTNPRMISELIKLGLVDYVALDVKAPLEKNKYKDITGVSIKTPTLGKINQSIRILSKSGVDYEIRTTLIKEKHSFHDILDICETIVGCKRYCLQEFKSDIVFDETYNKYSSYPANKLERMIKAINPEIKEVFIKE
jgi:pyruvate formate lyase activating enzyme